MRGRSVVLVVVASAFVAGCSSAPHRGSGFSVRAPTCTTAVAGAPVLANVTHSLVSLAGNPWGVAVTADGRWSFVSQNQSGQLAVLSETAFAPKLVREISLPAGSPAGETLTRDGRYLLIAVDSGVVVVSVPRAENGRAGAVLGVLSAGGSGAVGVAVSADGRFAFATLEQADRLAVFDLAAAIGEGFHGSHLVGTVTLGHAVVGIAASPDGRRLYVTSELAAGPLRRARTTTGTLSVVDLRRAETDPSRAVVATVPAGCGPVRVAVSPNGRVVWVTARESNQLLGFSAALLDTNPSRALVARVRVGQAPVGLALVDRGRFVVVADSNRFRVPGARPDLTIVNARAALAGRPAVLRVVPTGRFPRELAPDPTRSTLLVTNFDSNQVEAVNTAAFP